MRGAIVDLRDAVSYHQLVLASEGRSIATQRQYLFFERLFLRYLDCAGLQATLDQLEPTTVREALQWYHHQPHRPRTRGGEVAGATFVDILRLFSRFLHREAVLDSDPLAGLRRVKIARRLRDPYTQAEIIALWGACRTSQMPVRDEALLLLLLDTGMRIGEACTITLDRLHLEQRLIAIGAEGKSRRERLVPIGAADKRDGGRTLRALRSYLHARPDSTRSGGRLFLGRDGYPLEATGGSQIIERLGKIGHVANAGPHRLRHTFATQYLVLHVGDELGLRRIMGHLSKEVLADYVHFAQSTLSQRAGNVSLAERWLEPHTEHQPIAHHGGPHSNVRAYHCARCQRRASVLS